MTWTRPTDFRWANYERAQSGEFLLIAIQSKALNRGDECGVNWKNGSASFATPDPVTDTQKRCVVQHYLVEIVILVSI